MKTICLSICGMFLLLVCVEGKEPVDSLLIPSAVDGVSEKLLSELRGEVRGKQVLLLIQKIKSGSSSGKELLYVTSMLAQSMDPEAIKALAENITLEMKESSYLPAMEALIEVCKEQAIPYILDQLGREREERRKYLLVRSMIKMKGEKFAEFVKENRHLWGKSVQEAVDLYHIY